MDRGENSMREAIQGMGPSDTRPMERIGENTAEILHRLEILREDIRYLLHEVRSPLSAVINYAGVLKGQPHSAIERDFLLDIIEDEARRISSTLENFSDVIHKDAENWITQTSFSPVPVSELCERAATRFRTIASKYTLCFAIPAHLPPVRADWHKMELVLRNLIGNAVKYSPEGGRIQVSAEERGKSVRVLVQDEGVGIPEECLEKIFEPSYRALPPECSDARGTGLGLTLSRRIVEAHGGQIGVRSTPGEGSIFFFDLPTHAASCP